MASSDFFGLLVRDILYSEFNDPLCTPLDHNFLKINRHTIRIYFILYRIRDLRPSERTCHSHNKSHCNHT